jgi:hypothetical protein
MAADDLRKIPIRRVVGSLARDDDGDDDGDGGDDDDLMVEEYHVTTMNLWKLDVLEAMRDVDLVRLVD